MIGRTRSSSTVASIRSVATLMAFVMTSHFGVGEGNPPTKDVIQDYCASEFFVANCTAAAGGGANDIVMIESGQYGRMRSGRCLGGSHGNLDCHVDVTWYLDRRCAGRRHCRVYVSGQVFHQVGVCSKELASFLEAKYTCVTAAPGKNLKVAEASCMSTKQVILSFDNEDKSDRKTTMGHLSKNRPGFGYIASETSVSTSLGTAKCPYRIRAAEGQRIRLTMHSFAGGRRSSAEPSSPLDNTDGTDIESLFADSGSNSASDTACYEIGTVWDYQDVASAAGSNHRRVDVAASRRQTLMACRTPADRRRGDGKMPAVSGLQSPHVLFDSDSNEVMVQLNSASVLADLSPFVIKYEVVGCPKPQPPPGGWLKVEKDSMTLKIGCNTTSEIWRMKCDANEWKLMDGRPNNCSHHIALTHRSNSIFNQEEGFPYGILLVVAIGVALGVFIGGTLLSVVAFCMKKRAAADATTFHPCEAESLSAAYNSCAYHPSTLQHYQQQQQQLQHPSSSRAMLHPGSTASDDRRYRTVCYPASSTGGSNAQMMGPLPLPLDDYNPKSGGGMVGEFGKFFVTTGHGTGYGGAHLYESPHFDVISTAGCGATTPNTAVMTGPVSLQQQSEMASPHSHKLICSSS